jgi:hypothetical protein
MRSLMNPGRSVMRKTGIIFSMLAASLILSAMPVLSAEEAFDQGGSKDECLLVAMTCRDSVDSIQQRIDRLNKEIAKGTAVYSADELGILNSKLNDAIRLFHMIVDEPASTS